MVPEMGGLISIVLPVYNGERFLKESIESILNQTYPDWELILIDDRSTDSTPSICRRYADLDDRIHYYRNDVNRKLPGSLNEGFSHAAGDYLTWTSDDNEYRPEALERMYDVLSKNPGALLVYASFQVMDENGRPSDVFAADRWGKDHITGSNVVGACFLFTREAWHMTGQYDESLFLVEDFDYWQRMMALGDAVVIDEVLYDYRMHGNSLTSTKNHMQFGLALERMLKKNRALYEPMNLERRRYFYNCLRTSYKAQGKRLAGSFRAFFFEYSGRAVNKIAKLTK